MGQEESPKGQSERPEKEEDGFSFMQEIIKDEKEGAGKIKNRALKCAGLGLAFGMSACLGFYGIKPWAEKKFQGNQKKAAVSEKREERKKRTKEAVPTANIKNYKELHGALAGVAEEAQRSVVKIAAVKEGEDWDGELSDPEKTAAGALVGENGSEFLILVKEGPAKEGQRLTAEFVDGRICPVRVKRRDANVGFALLSVLKADVPKSTKGRIRTARLGSSEAMGEGETVIAIGSPFGSAWSMGVGIISSAGQVREEEDGNYGLLCTDIAAAEGGAGILVNLDGEVVGILEQKEAEKKGVNLVRAYGITDLKDHIRLLSGGKPVPYIGIKGATITKEMSEERRLPMGVYVKDVGADSPAMEAGVQSGDVLTSFGGKRLGRFSSYHSLLMKKEEGDEVKLKGKRQGAGGYVDVEFTVTIGSME